MTDTGVFNGTNFRNGTQYFGRADKYFDNDRIYFSVFRTLNDYGGPGDDLRVRKHQQYLGARGTGWMDAHVQSHYAERSVYRKQSGPGH